MRSNTHRAQKTLHGGARLILVAALLAQWGCLLPEIDTPPIDPSLVPVETTTGSGGGEIPAAQPCVAGTYKGNVTLTAKSSTTGYKGECTIQGSVSLNLDFPGYTKLAKVKMITGSVTIMAQQATGAVFVLPNLEEVRSNVYVMNTKLSHVPVFPRLASISRTLGIHGNPNLTAIRGFDALTKVGTLSITGNTKATSWATFGKLIKIAGPVDVRDNLTLKRISFPQVERFITDLRVINNPKATTLTLPRASSVNRLELQRNSALSQVKAGEVSFLNRMILDRNTALGDSGLGFHQVTQVQDLWLLQQPKITALTWLSAKPKVTFTLKVCSSGITLQEALAWLKSVGSTPKKTMPCP